MWMKPDSSRFGGGGIAPNGRSISKGMHLPVVGDTDIQWHLRCSTYDRCRSCGSDDVGFITQTKRCCMKCNSVFELSVKPVDWWQEIGSHLRVLNRVSRIEEICAVGDCERVVKPDGVIGWYCDRHQYAGTAGRGPDVRS